MFHTLQVAQLVPDTEAEGPGRRFALWVQGCTLRCPGCCNPEMFGARGGEGMSVDDVLKRITETEGIEGVSFLGGEPFEQAEPLAVLARGVRDAGLSVMIYTGFTMTELDARDDEATRALIAATDLLVDGRYERDNPEPSRRWIGSKNQKMHFLTDRYDPADPQFGSNNTIEIRMTKDGISINGWPKGADFLKRHKTKQTKSPEPLSEDQRGATGQGTNE